MAKTLGLALGTGGARGWAHVGVIRALEEADIKIDLIGGTSIGSLVGAVYLAGSLDRLEKFAQEAEPSRFRAMLDIAFPAPGLIKGNEVRNFISEYVADQRLEDTAIPFRCVATNFLRKQEVVLTSGLMADAVRASISIPGIFSPFKLDEDIYLVDGGIINPLPVSVVQDMGADVVVAINLNPDMSFDHPDIMTSDSSGRSDRDQTPAANASQATEQAVSSGQNSEQDAEDNVFNRIAHRYEQLKNTLMDETDRWIPNQENGINIFDVLGNSIDVMEKRVTQANLLIHKPDILIEPDLTEFGTFDFHLAQTIMPRGYEAAKAMIPEIRKLLDR